MVKPSFAGIFSLLNRKASLLESVDILGVQMLSSLACPVIFVASSRVAFMFLAIRLVPWHILGAFSLLRNITWYNHGSSVK